MCIRDRKYIDCVDTRELVNDFIGDTELWQMGNSATCDIVMPPLAAVSVSVSELTVHYETGIQLRLVHFTPCIQALAYQFPL